jgi:hypothetical protein
LIAIINKMEFYIQHHPYILEVEVEVEAEVKQEQQERLGQPV